MTEKQTSTNASNVLSNVDVVRAPIVVSSNSSLDTSAGSVTRRLDIDNAAVKQEELSSSSTKNDILQLPPIQSSNQLLQKIPLQQYQIKNNHVNNHHHPPAPCPIPNTIPSIPYPPYSNHNNIPKSLPGTQLQKPLIRKTNASSSSHNNTVPEFLYQLTKLLTDDNRHVIEWSKGKIEVHNPPKLASDILHRYFRHSKYASFQRQLNYFGFRKLAGKGKMSPCSYVNDEITEDIRSLLSIKRKTTGSKDKKVDNHNNLLCIDNGLDASKQTKNAPVVNPVLAGILNQSRSQVLKRPFDQVEQTESNPHFKLAVGKGIKHKLNGYLKPNSATSSPSISTSLPLTGPNVLSLNQNQLAKSVVGRGVTHQYVQNTIPPPSPATTSINPPVINSSSPAPSFTFLDPHQLGMGITDCLSELKNNFANSLVNTENSQNNSTSNGSKQHVSNGKTQTQNSNGTTSQTPLSRISSLVDLAMIPTIETEKSLLGADKSMLDFLDFSNDDVLK